MLQATFEADDAFRSLEAIPAMVDRQRSRLLGAAGKSVRRDAYTNLMVKAHGGRGEDGVTWKKPTPTEARRKQRLGQPLIGVRTGRMLAESNLELWERDDGVVIDFGPAPADIEKAAIFDAERPLLPKTLPQRWYRNAQSAAQATVNSVVLGDL